MNIDIKACALTYLHEIKNCEFIGFNKIKSRSPCFTAEFILKTFPPKKNMYNESAIYSVIRKIITASWLNSPSDWVNWKIILKKKNNER